MKNSRRTWAILLGIFAVVCFAVVLYLIRPPAQLAENLPVPNGFDELVAAENAWSAAVGTSNKMALVAQLRSGLAKKCQMPLAIARQAFQVPPVPVNSKPVVLGLVELAEAEAAAGRSGEAVKLWSDALHYSPARVRGGLAIHVLTAIAPEKRVVESIGTQLSRLSPADRAALIASLRLIDSAWEPAKIWFARDLALALEQTAPQQRLLQRFAVRYLGTLEKMEANLAQKLKAMADRRAQLIKDLER